MPFICTVCLNMYSVPLSTVFDLELNRDAGFESPYEVLNSNQTYSWHLAGYILFYLSSTLKLRVVPRSSILDSVQYFLSS